MVSYNTPRRTYRKRTVRKYNTATRYRRAPRRRAPRRRRVQARRLPFIEQRLEPFTGLQDLAGRRITNASGGNRNTYWRGLVVGSGIPPDWGQPSIGNFDSIGGMDFQSNNAFNYINLKHSMLNVTINMQYGDNNWKPPTEFRMIVGMSRRKTLDSADISPYDNLFIDDNGASLGAKDMNNQELMTRMLNRRQFSIMSDKKFILSSPFNVDSDGGYGGYSGKYPVMKNCRFKLPYGGKTFLFSDGSARVPRDTPYRYFMFLYAASTWPDETANNWEISSYGTTVYEDI